jgi:hypothetical protein
MSLLSSHDMNVWRGPAFELRTGRPAFLTHFSLGYSPVEATGNHTLPRLCYFLLSLMAHFSLFLCGLQYDNDV